MNVILEYDGGLSDLNKMYYNNINIEYNGGSANTLNFNNDNNIMKTILNKCITKIIGGNNY